jgi:hypothetical protein
MATTPNTTTTILGKTYPGRPIGLALRMRTFEQAGQPEKARAVLNAHNCIRLAFGQRPYDLAADFTTLPMEGGFTIQALPTVAVAPRALNSRLWKLTGKETAHAITPSEKAELDAICADLEGSAA